MIKTSLEPYGEFFQYPENVPVWSVDSRVSGNVGISSEADVEADVEIDGLRNIDERTIRQWTTRAPFADMLSTEPDEEPEEGE